MGQRKHHKHDIGTRFGYRVIVNFERDNSYLVRCDCGNESIVQGNAIGKYERCAECAKHSKRGEYKTTRGLVDSVTRYENDVLCQELVAASGSYGLESTEIARFMDLSPERIRVVIKRALRKVRQELMKGAA